MQTCPECGNHDMSVRLLEGATVHECGLCGARFGAPRAVMELAADDEARRAGVDEAIWPLARVLAGLGGLELSRAAAGSPDLSTMPEVELLVGHAGALVQIENLAKSLRLAEGSLRCRWGIEVCYERALAIIVGARAGAAATLRDAHIDIEVLARQLQRDMRLKWWRHAIDAPGS